VLGTSSGWNQYQVISITIDSAKKRDLVTVGRPCRVRILGRIGCQTLWTSRVQRQDMNVEIILRISVPGKSHAAIIR
jgi:tRNA pseudouridine-54 N-methylase